MDSQLVIWVHELVIWTVGQVYGDFNSAEGACILFEDSLLFADTQLDMDSTL